MEQVKSNKEWYLMCPDKCPGLSDVYGDEFVELYNKYISEGKYLSKVNARDLWFKVLDSQMETGTPYLYIKMLLIKSQINLISERLNHQTYAPKF